MSALKLLFAIARGCWSLGGVEAIALPILGQLREATGTSRPGQSDHPTAMLRKPSVNHGFDDSPHGPNHGSQRLQGVHEGPEGHGDAEADTMEKIKESSGGE